MDMGNNMIDNTNENIKETPVDEEKTLLVQFRNIGSRMNRWSWGAAVCLLAAIYTLIKGVLHLFTNGLFAYSDTMNLIGDPVYASVGGDVYTYLIKGEYAIAYFVLTTMFVMASIGLMILHYVSRNRE